MRTGCHGFASQCSYGQSFLQPCNLRAPLVWGYIAWWARYDMGILYIKNNWWLSAKSNRIDWVALKLKWAKKRIQGSYYYIETISIKIWAWERSLICPCNKKQQPPVSSHFHKLSDKIPCSFNSTLWSLAFPSLGKKREGEGNGTLGE